MAQHEIDDATLAKLADAAGLAELWRTRPDEVRAAFELAAQERAALLAIDDPAVTPWPLAWTGPC